MTKTHNQNKNVRNQFGFVGGGSSTHKKLTEMYESSLKKETTAQS